jgi:hypothetical protein
MEQIAVSSLMEERMRWTREILKRHSRSGLAQHPDAQQPAQGRDHKAQQKHRLQAALLISINGFQQALHVIETRINLNSKLAFAYLLSVPQKSRSL